MIETSFLEISQRNFLMYSVVLTVDELLNNTVVEYYRSDTEIYEGYHGYQRPLVSTHIRKIARYLQGEVSPLLPTSLLMAVYPDQVSKSGNLLRIDGKLRVVDGQHRIEGIRYLETLDRKAFQRVKQFNFPVVLLVLGREDKVHEISAFVNINKAGKQVDTNLAAQLRDQIKGDDYEKMSENPKETIATRVTSRLRENPGSVWYENIQLGDVKTKSGVISANAFQQSLQELVGVYLDVADDRSLDSVQDFDDVINDVSVLVGGAWENVERRWLECFPPYPTDDKKFNIQKGIGVYPIHMVLSRVLSRSGGDTDKTMQEFKRILNNSKITYTDWKTGGILSSYNTKVGFQEIANCILNGEKPKKRLVE